MAEAVTTLPPMVSSVSLPTAPKTAPRASWIHVAIIQLGSLNIAAATPGLATLSWTSATSPGFVLQYADALAPTYWLKARTARRIP